MLLDAIGNYFREKKELGERIAQNCEELSVLWRRTSSSEHEANWHKQEAETYRLLCRSGRIYFTPKSDLLTKNVLLETQKYALTQVA